jgi:hypothetical protein
MNQHKTHLPGASEDRDATNAGPSAEEPDDPFQAPPEVSVKDYLRSISASPQRTSARRAQTPTGSSVNRSVFLPGTFFKC